MASTEEYDARVKAESELAKMSSKLLAMQEELSAAKLEAQKLELQLGQSQEELTEALKDVDIAEGVAKEAAAAQSAAQKEAAEKTQTAEEELAGISQLHKKIARLEKTIEEKDTVASKNEQSLDAQIRKESEMQKKMEELKVSVKKHINLEAVATKENEALKQRLEQYEGSSDGHSDGLIETRKMLAEANKTIEKLTKKKDELMDQCGELNAELSREMRLRMLAKEELSTVTGGTAISSTTHIVLSDEAKQEKDDANALIARLTKQVKDGKMENELLREKIEKLSRASPADLELDKLRAQVAELSAEKVKLLSRLAETDTQCWVAEKELQQLSVQTGTAPRHTTKRRGITTRDLPQLPEDEGTGSNDKKGGAFPEDLLFLEENLPTSGTKSVFARRGDIRRKLMAM